MVLRSRDHLLHQVRFGNGRIDEPDEHAEQLAVRRCVTKQLDWRREADDNLRLVLADAIDVDTIKRLARQSSGG
jgi:hypothetical protein